MSTLEDRARTAVAYAKTQGRIVHEREIPRKARLLGGAMSDGYMGRLWVSLKKNPNGNQHREQLTLLAQVCGVRRDWLIYAEDPMEAGDRASESRPAVKSRKR